MKRQLFAMALMGLLIVAGSALASVAPVNNATSPFNVQTQMTVADDSGAHVTLTSQATIDDSRDIGFAPAATITTNMPVPVTRIDASVLTLRTSERTRLAGQTIALSPACTSCHQAQNVTFVGTVQKTSAGNFILEVDTASAAPKAVNDEQQYGITAANNETSTASTVPFNGASFTTPSNNTSVTYAVATNVGNETPMDRYVTTQATPTRIFQGGANFTGTMVPDNGVLSNNTVGVVDAMVATQVGSGFNVMKLGATSSVAGTTSLNSYDTSPIGAGPFLRISSLQIASMTRQVMNDSSGNGNSDETSSATSTPIASITRTSTDGAPPSAKTN